MQLSESARLALAVFIGGVWLFHGCYSKLWNGIPRHRQIVGRILGDRHARALTVVIGLMEAFLGVWVISGRARVLCAVIQTTALVAMNSIEIWLARDLLISPAGMAALNALFIALIWVWAAS
jgi:hypothetical protein